VTDPSRLELLTVAEPSIIVQIDGGSIWKEQDAPPGIIPRFLTSSP